MILRYIQWEWRKALVEFDTISRVLERRIY